MSTKVLLLIFWSAMLISKIWAEPHNEENLEETLVEKISNLPQLYRSIRPYNKDGEPPNVEVDMHIYSITNIDSSMQHFEIDMIIRQTWQDHRLNFTEQLNTNHTLTIKYADTIRKIWIPDLFVSNAKITKHQHRIDNQDLAQILRIIPGGKIQYTNRLALQVFCDMHLQKFPADKQKCKIVVESYGDSEELIRLAWVKKECPVLFEGKYGSPQFNIFGPCPEVSTSFVYYADSKLLEHRLSKEWTWNIKPHDIRDMLYSEPCNFTLNPFRDFKLMYFKPEQEFIGKFAVLVAYMEFSRRVTSFVFTVYIPAAMIVLLSTVSFWIRPGSVPARIALGITTVLSEATVMSGALNAYPTVSYLKALDLYTMVCFCFTFCVLIEYAIVHIIMNKKVFFHQQDQTGQLEDDEEDVVAHTEGQQNVKQVDEHHPSWTPTSNLKFESGYTNGGFPLRKIPSRSFQAIFNPNLPPDKRQNYRRKPKMTEEEKRRKERQLLIDFTSPLDTVSRVIFPVAFVVFNIFYFLWMMAVI